MSIKNLTYDIVKENSKANLDSIIYKYVKFSFKPNGVPNFNTILVMTSRLSLNWLKMDSSSPFYTEKCICWPIRWSEKSAFNWDSSSNCQFTLPDKICISWNQLTHFIGVQKMTKKGQKKTSLEWDFFWKHWPALIMFFEDAL